MEKIFELAKELGDALADHPTVKQYEAARKAMDADPTTRQLIGDYEKSAEALARKEKEGRPIEPEEKRSLAALQGKIAANDAVKKMLQAQIGYLNLLRQINALVIKQPPEEAAKA